MHTTIEIPNNPLPDSRRQRDQITGRRNVEKKLNLTVKLSRVPIFLAIRVRFRKRKKKQTKIIASLGSAFSEHFVGTTSFVSKMQPGAHGPPQGIWVRSPRRGDSFVHLVKFRPLRRLANQVKQPFPFSNPSSVVFPRYATAPARRSPHAATTPQTPAD